MSELKETQKINFVQLHEQTPKQLLNRITTPEIALKYFLNPSPTPKIARQSPKKVKNDPKIKSKLKVRNEGTIENKSYSTT